MPTKNDDENKNYEKWISLANFSLFGLILGMGFVFAVFVMIPHEDAPDWYKAIVSILVFLFIYLGSIRFIFNKPRTIEVKNFVNTLKWVTICCIVSNIIAVVISRTMTYDILLVLSMGCSLLIVVSAILATLVVSMYAIDSHKKKSGKPDFIVHTEGLGKPLGFSGDIGKYHDSRVIKAFHAHMLLFEQVTFEANDEKRIISSGKLHNGSDLRLSADEFERLMDNLDGYSEIKHKYIGQGKHRIEIIPIDGESYTIISPSQEALERGLVLFRGIIDKAVYNDRNGDKALTMSTGEGHKTTYCPYCREKVGLICSLCGELQSEENEYGFLCGAFECSGCGKKAQAQCAKCRGDLHMMIGR